MCGSGMEGLAYIMIGIGILFLPLTLLAAIGWGTAIVGAAGLRSAAGTHEEITKKLLEHGLNKHVAELQYKLESKPEDTTSRFQRAMAFYVKDDLVNATADLQLCYTYGMRNVELCFFLGNFYYKVGSYEDAEKMFKLGVHLAKHPDEVTVKALDANGNLVPFNTFEIYNARASTLYRLAFEENTPEHQKWKHLALAYKEVTKCSKLVESPNTTNEDRTRVYQMQAVASFYNAFHPNRYQDYYSSSWARAKLILLGTQDPGSPLSMIRDSDFIWQFFFKSLKSAMKRDRSLDHQFYGILASDESRTFLRESHAISTNYSFNFSDDAFGLGVRKVAEFSTYFCQEQPYPCVSPNHLTTPTVHPFWRSRYVVDSGYGPSLPQVNFRWSIEYEMPEGDYLVDKKFNFSWLMLRYPPITSDDCVLADTQALEWSMEAGHFRVEFRDNTTGALYPDITLHLTRVGNKFWGERYSGNLKGVDPNNPNNIFTSPIRVKFTFEDLKSHFDAINKFLLSVPYPFEVQDPDRSTVTRLANAHPCHHFKSVRLRRPSWCQHCGHAIKSWGLASHLQCKTCNMVIHGKCKESVVATCYQ